MFHTKAVAMFMVFPPTKVCMSTPTAQDVININCRDTFCLFTQITLN